MKNNIFKYVCVLLGFYAITTIIGCDFGYDLPEENSQEDLELPTANFTWQQDVDSFKVFQFANTSSESSFFRWDFGNGDIVEEESPIYEFKDGEGSYSVTLTSSDANGESATITHVVEVVEPEAPAVPDVRLINAVFDKLPKSSGSDCACSGWINKSLGEQGETSEDDGRDVLKFDNAEPDHIYQEFEVVPNAEYIMKLTVNFRSLQGTAFPSELEVRVLAGSGYTSGYTPQYYDEPVEFPQDNFGYSSMAEVELEENNLLTEVLSNPSDGSYIEYTLSFNSGANESAALFMRGIGNSDPPEDPADFEKWGYCSGDEEIRLDIVKILAL